VWDDTLTGQLLKATRPPYELSLWQTLTPAAWEVITCLALILPHLDCKYIYNCQTDSTVCAHSASGLREFVAYIVKSGGDCETHQLPAEATLDKLLIAPPDGLGVPLADVILHRNGWKVPNDDLCFHRASANMPRYADPAGSTKPSLTWLSRGRDHR
jgi:hypothetical protein